MEVQTNLFDILEARYPKRSDLIPELCELLNLGQDAIYRRMRGDTVTTPDEIAKICRHYKISLDALIHNDTSSVFFEFSAFRDPIQSVDQYINKLKETFHKVQSIPNGKIYYASSEIPVFYYAFYPDLLLFKLYVWGQTIWDIEEFKDKPFSLDLISKAVRQQALELVRQYIKMDTIELWSQKIAENTLNQILYHAEIGGFKHKEESLKLCEDLAQVIRHFQEMAKAERKFMPGQPEASGHFALYHNEMIYTNNTIFFHSEHLKTLFTTFANPNFLQTTDTLICDYSEQWFQELIKKSAPLSGNVEKARNKYFQSIHHSIKRTKLKIEALMHD